MLMEAHRKKARSANECPLRSMSSTDIFADPRRPVDENVAIQGTLRSRSSFENWGARSAGGSSSCAAASSSSNSLAVAAALDRADAGVSFCDVVLGRAVAALGHIAAETCGSWMCGFASSSSSPVPPGRKDEPAPRRWYRVHPLGDAQYFVRPDAGRRGRIPGLPADLDADDRSLHMPTSEAPDIQLMKSRRKGPHSHLSGSQSVPAFLERKLGLKDPPGFECDSFRNCCKICYDEQIEVVLLPCRHGIMCRHCLRRTLYSRPSHRGGRNCPLCRKRVREVIYIFGDAAIPQYGFTLKLPS